MFKNLLNKAVEVLFSVPVRIKVLGIVIIPVLFLGLSLNYWVTTGLSDWLSYLIPDDRVVVAMEAGGRSVVLVSILAALAAILFSMLMMYLLTQPLLELSKAANRVAKGDLASRANVWSHDEIGEVATSFNEMVDHLVQSQEDLKQSNRQLALMNKIAIASTIDQDIHDTLFTMLCSVLEAIDASTGWIYLFNEETDLFHLATWYEVPDEMKPILLSCDPEERCACQQQMLSENSQLEARIIECDRFGNSHGKHIALNLQAGEKPLGVINLLIDDEKPLADEDNELLSVACAQIGEFVAKAWLQLKLSEKEMSRQKLMKALIKAQEDERTRLARELHDGAGQMLTSLNVQMKAFERATQDETVSGRLNHLCDNVSEVIEYIRQISYQNRPVVLDEFGLEQAIHNLVEEMFNDADINYNIDIRINNIPLPKEIEATIYRITQESLTNVIRHANATNVDITMWVEGGRLYLQVCDNGSGFDIEEFFSSGSERHMGIITIRDRLELLGGRLNLTSSPGGGTTLLAVLPMLEEITYAR